MNILIPILVLGGLGLLFGIWLVFAHKIFAVEIDPRVEKILGILPGVNCGACGSAGCQGFAAALIKGETQISACAPGGEETQHELAQVLGVEVTSKTKQIASLICGGGKTCVDKYNYVGPKTCQAANLMLEGQKACAYGCLGFGDCVSACPFGAIVIGEDDLPIIDPGKCTACKKCIVACPKKVLILKPADKFYQIKCNSTDRGAQVMRACKVGCIACNKCVKSCPVGAIKLEDNLAKIDYDKCINCSKCVNECPTKAITVEQRDKDKTSR